VADPPTTDVGRVPAPGAHGGDGARIAAALGLDPATVLDLSHTLNPFAADPVPIVARHLGAVRQYPHAAFATRALADALGVPVESVLVTNGGAEAIALAVGALRSGRVEPPEFSLHERHLRRIDATGPLVRSNPNNPTGLLAAPDAVAAVWDEAFWPLATGTWTRGDADHGSVVVGSLTKLLACPGLRLGYVLGDPSTVERLTNRQPAWSVSGPASAALPDLLDTVDLPTWSTRIDSARDALVEVLTGAGLAVRPSDAPWVLVDEPGLRERLAPHGVVVRDGASFGLPGTYRIAVPDPRHLDRLATTLALALGHS